MTNISDSAQARFDRTVAANPDAVVGLLDVEGQVLAISPSMETIHGYAPDEVVGQSFAEFFDCDDVAHLGLAIQDCILTGKSVEVSRRVKHKSGEYKSM